MKKIVCLLSALALAAAATEAKETRLRVPDRGLLGAMQRMGCSAAWLSRVMEQNRIAESELRRLPEGLRLAMPACGSETPDSRTIALSREILGRQDRLQAVINSRQNESLANEIRERLKQLESAQADNKKLSAQVERLGERIAALTATNEKMLARQGVPWWSLVLALLIGGTAVALAWFVWYRRHQRELDEETRDRPERNRMFLNEEREEVKTIPVRVVHDHAGQKVEFQLVNEPIHYKCPLCLATDIEEHNLARHLRKAHPADSVPENQDQTVQSG